MVKRRILLADDDAEDRVIFHEYLGDRGDITLLPFAENGVEVFNFLETAEGDNLPDIIILDQNMPKMNGRQTLEQLKTSGKYAGITVFVYSTYIDKTLVEYCKNLGAASVVTKPITRNEYHALMDNCIKFLKPATEAVSA